MIWFQLNTLLIVGTPTIIIIQRIIQHISAQRGWLMSKCQRSARMTDVKMSALSADDWSWVGCPPLGGSLVSDIYFCYYAIYPFVWCFCMNNTSKYWYILVYTWCQETDWTVWLTPRGYSVQKTLQGCAANMGSKISLLVYEWPHIKCKIRYMNGSIFQNFPKFEPKLAQI